MPIFDNNGKKQNVQDVHVEKYMELYPDATTVMERDGKKYRVKAKDYNTFLGDTLQTSQAATAPQVPDKSQYTFTASQLGLDDKDWLAQPVEKRTYGETQTPLRPEEPVVENTTDEVVAPVFYRREKTPLQMTENEYMQRVQRRLDQGKYDFSQMRTEQGMTAGREDVIKKDGRYYTPEGSFDSYLGATEAVDNAVEYNGVSVGQMKDYYSTDKAKQAEYAKSIGKTPEEIEGAYEAMNKSNLEGQMKDLYQRIGEGMKDVNSQMSALQREHNKDRGFGTFVKDAVMGASVNELPVLRGQIPGSTLEITPEWQNLKKEDAQLWAAARQYNTAQQMIDAAKSGNFDQGFSNAMRELIQGGVVQDMQDLSAIREVSDRFERGKKLTKNEEMLLESLAMGVAVASQYQDEISAWYNAGKMTGEMIPYMVEMWMNPMSKLGKNLGRKVVEKAKKKYAKDFAKHKVGTAVKKGLANLGGSIAGGYGMALTTGLPSVITGVQERTMGDVKVTDNNGVVEYAGRENAEGVGSAIYKETTQRMLDNASEMLGAGYLGKPFNWLRNAGKGTKLLGWIDNVASSKYGKAFGDFMEATNWNGPLEEFMEELHVGVASPLLTGEGKVSDFFKGKNLATVAIGVAVPGAAFATLATVQGAKDGAFKAGAKERWKMQRGDIRAREAWGEKWDDLRSKLESPSLEEVDKTLTEINNDKSLTPEQKVSAFEYGIYSLQYKTARGVADAFESRKDGLSAMLKDVYANGYVQEPTGAVALSASEELKTAEMNVRTALGLTNDEDVDAYIANIPAEDLAKGDEDVLDIINEYKTAKARFEGIQDKFQDTREEQYRESDKSIDGMSNNGFIYSIKNDEGEIFITGGNVVLNENGTIDYDKSSEALYVKYPDSHVEMVPAASLMGQVSVENAEELKAVRRAEIDAKWKADFDNAETAANEQQKRANGMLFEVNDPTGTHAVEVLEEGAEESKILFDGAEYDIPTEELNKWREEAGIVSQKETDEQLANSEDIQPAESVPVVESIPTEKVGKDVRAAYHLVPIERTLEDLHDGALEQEEIDALIQARVDEAQRVVNVIEKKKPVMGASKEAYLVAKQQWKAGQEAAQQKLNYYNELQKREAERNAQPVESVAPIEESKPVVETLPTEEVRNEESPKITFEEYDDADYFIHAVESKAPTRLQEYLDNFPEGIYRDGARAAMWMNENGGSQEHMRVYIMAVGEARKVIRDYNRQQTNKPAVELTEDVKTENVNQSEDNLEMVAEGENAPLAEISNDERAEMEARIVDWLSEENLERAEGKTREEIFDEFGNELEPIAYIPKQYISIVSADLKDQRIYCGKGYFIDHALRNHAKDGKQLNVEDVDVSKYLNIQSVLDNPDSVKETYVDGKRTVVFIKKIGRYFAELTQVEEDGKIVLHKSMFNQKKEPYAKLNDIRSKGTSSEGGVSSISHTADAAPAISLESRGDVVSNSTVSSVSEDRNYVSNAQENTQKSDENAENRGEITETPANPTDSEPDSATSTNEDELDIYLAELKAQQERQKTIFPKLPRPSSFVEAYASNDTEAINKLDKQFNDALQTLVPMDITMVEATIKGMKDRKSIIKAGSANERKETPAYKAFDHIEKALAKRKKQLEKELTEDDKRRIDIIKRGNRGVLKETPQPKQENKPVESEPIKDETPVTSETTEQPETNDVANAGPVNRDTLQLNMSDEDFNALLNGGDKTAISEYLAEMDGLLRIGVDSPLDGQEALREEYRKAVEQYGKENIPAEVMDDLNSRMQPYSDLSRAIFDRKYALQDKLREIEASEAQANEQAEKEAKAERKKTAFGGFLAGKTDLGAGSAEKALSKKYNFDGKVMTVAEFVEDAVGNGNVKLSAMEEPKYKGASRAAWNRMDARQQEADAKRVKESGTKTVYTVNDHDLGKTAYDYAKFLLDKKAAAEQMIRERIEPFAKKKDAEQTTVKIEDVGEKIGGARKDIIRQYADKIKLDGKTFSTMFPKPDIDKLVEAGLPKDKVAAVKAMYDNAKREFEIVKKRRGKDKALQASLFYAMYAKNVLTGEEGNFDLAYNGFVFTEWGKEFMKANIALYKAVFNKLGTDYGKVDLRSYFITPLAAGMGKNFNLKKLNEENSRMQQRMAEMDGRKVPEYKDGDLINFVGEHYSRPSDQFVTLEEAVNTMVERISKEVKVDEAAQYKVELYWKRDAQGRADYTKAYLGIKVRGFGTVDVMEFKNMNEARAWLQDHREDFQQMAAAKEEQVKAENKKPLPKYILGHSYNEAQSQYSVFADFGKEGVKILKTFNIPQAEGVAAQAKARSEVYKNDVLPYMNSEEAVRSADGIAQEIRDAKNAKQKPVTVEKKSRERVGVDWRNGKNATPDMFVDVEGKEPSVFGFRAVEFGNYVTQKERQQYLNDLYDALMDMSELLGVSPRALSLGGRLALAVGARGTSGASGHYEPYKNVINITKTSGAGVLAHEWLHAFDRYFSNFDENALYPNGVMYATQGMFADDTRQEVKDAFEKVMLAVKASDYRDRSMRLGEYWASEKELAARALQDYIIRKLDDRGQKNDFLSNHVAPEEWDGDAKGYPFPLGEDAKRIADAFDNLFATLEEKTTEEGKVVLYKKSKNKIDILDSIEKELSLEEPNKPKDEKSAIPPQDVAVRIHRSYDEIGRGTGIDGRVADIVRRFNEGRVILADTPLLRDVLKLLRRLTNNEIQDGLLPYFEKKVREETNEQYKKEYEDIVELIKRFRNRNERRAVIKDLLGVELDEDVVLSKIDELFELYNHDKGVSVLYKRVRDVVQETGISFSFSEFEDEKTGIYDLTDNRIRLNAHILYSPYLNDQEKASTIVHEMIHAVSCYAIAQYENGNKTLSPELSDAAKTIIDIYNKAVKNNPKLVHEVYNTDIKKMQTMPDYGTENAYEMVAELANPDFAEKLKDIKYDGRSVWRRLWDAIKSIFVGKKADNSTAYDALTKAFDILVDNFDKKMFEDARRDGDVFNRIADMSTINEGEQEVIEQQEENEESIAKDAVTQLGEALNAPVTIIDDLNSLPENRRNNKGWFDPKTSEVVVVIPNHVSSEDAVQTVLHEVVGHRGLRAVLGEKFDEFLDDVFKNASPEVKRGISDKFFGALRKGHALTVREATEEYIAELAERGFEGYNGVWNSIKQWLKDAFRSLVGFEVTDNELRYLLWKSYNRQKSGPIEAILDIAMEAKTGTGNTMFRVVEDYNKGVQGVWNKAKEGWYDEMRSIKVAQEAIEKELGREVLDSENVYLYANHLPSINKNKKEVFDNKYLKPFTSLLKKLYELEVNGQKMDEKSVERYTNAKHGIERNREMSVKKALTEVQDGKKVFNEEAYAVWAQERDAVRKRKLPWTEEQRELDKVAKKYGAKIRDFSGLTAVFDAEGKMKYAQIADAAYKYVEDVESAGGKDIKELWKLIKGMTDYSLKEAYESGMMSKSTYEHIKQMYKYYVPLRGFTEQTTEDFFDYVEGDHSPLNAVVKTAKGRTSEAENIFATILNMANSAIVQGSKNRLKQRLLNLAMRSRTGLLSVDNAWYAQVGDEYIPVEYPENADEYAAFEERMKELEKNGEVVRHRPGLEIGKKVADKWNQQQHAVRVKRNGREYIVWVNGDPRLANAVNGMLRENFDETWIGALNRWRAQMVTQYSPTFIFTNLVRDVQEASMTYAVRRGTKMMGNFDLNVAANSVKMMSLYLKYKKGALNEEIPVERYFKEFLENGGETGYTEMISIEQYEKQLKKLTEGLNMKNATERAFEAVGEGVEFANRCIENLCRFSAYQTSREAGMSILKSIEDAKEVSVNFNRKGSGAMGQKWAKAFYMFLNPAIQSLAKRILLTKKFPKKMAAVWAGEFVMGATAPLLWSLIRSMFGDDEDKDELMGNYFNLTDFRRRSGLCMPGKDGVFHIPLSHEARALYGLGELFTSYVMGHEKYDNLPIQIFNTLSQSLPLNPLDGWAPGENILESMAYSLTPDAVKPIAEVIMNRDFAGNKVHNRSDFNEFLPEYMRGKRSTADIYKSISKVLSGKEIYGKGVLDNLVGTLVNPSTMEHLVEGYLGGAYSFADKAVKTGKWILGNEEFAEFKNVPIGSSFYTSLTKYEDKPREERTRRDWEDAFKFYQQEVKYYDDKETAAKNGEKNGEESGTLVLEQMERNGEVLMVDIFNDGNDRLKELYSASDVARRNGEFDKVQEIDKQIYAEKMDIVERMEKLADDPMIGYTFRRNKIKGVYGELETYGDVRDANIINDFQTELKPIQDEYMKVEDWKAYKKLHEKELGMYEDLKRIESDISYEKSKMKENPAYAEEGMTEIRTLRAEAIKLINEYGKK